MRYLAAILAALFLLTGCGAACQSERAAAAGIAGIMETLPEGHERDYAEAQFEAAETVVEDCEAANPDEAGRQHFGEIAMLVMKVLLELVRAVAVEESEPVRIQC
jgi:hypothetical protein